MEGATAVLVAMAAALIGLIFGAMVQRSHFCTMGCVGDAVLFGSFRRARIWALAILVALLGSQALAAAGLVDLGASRYRTPGLFWLGAVTGGLMFGFGMVLAGGCASRNLVRAGAGSLKAVVTLLVMAVCAYATMAGLLAPAHALLRAGGTLDLSGLGATDQGLPAILAAISGGGVTLLTGLVTLAVGAGLLAFALGFGKARMSRDDLFTGLVLGALVPAAWLVTGWLGADAFEPVPVESLSFVATTASGLLAVMLGTGWPPSFGVALVGGTLLGAFVVAGSRGQLRLETFVARDDMLRHVTGGALMGVGGVLATGCTIGQGLSGVATLSLGSWLALAAILGGAWCGLRYLESGRLLFWLGPAEPDSAPSLPTAARSKGA